LKIANFSYPTLPCGAPLRMFYLELRGEVYQEETSHEVTLQWRPHDRSL